MQEYIISEEESNRVNILKFISIVFVVYIHSYSENINLSSGSIDLNIPRWLLFFENIISNGIARMAVPLFFLLSAIFLFKRDRNYPEMIKVKLRTLLIPFLFWNTIWIVLFWIFQAVPFTSSFFSNSANQIGNWNIHDFFRAYGISLYDYPFLYPLWFMRDLMVMTILYPLFMMITKRYSKLMLTLSLIILLIPVNFPYKTAFVFFLLGISIVRLNLRLKEVDKLSYKIIVPIYVILILLKVCTQNYVIYQLSILTGILFWIKISKKIYDSKFYKSTSWIKELMSFSFVIYVGHEMALTTCKKICIKVFPVNSISSFLEYLLLPVMIILICVLAGVLMKNKAPKVYRMLMGNR